MKRVLVLTLVVMSVLTSGAFAKNPDLFQVERSNSFYNHVCAWFSTNSSSVAMNFWFAGIEVLPLSAKAPSQSDVQSLVDQNISSRYYIEFDKDRSHNEVYVWNAEPSADVSEEFVREHMVNAILVKEGCARVKDYGPNQKYTQVLLKLQDEARNKHKGVWQE